LTKWKSATIFLLFLHVLLFSTRPDQKEEKAMKRQLATLALRFAVVICVTMVWASADSMTPDVTTSTTGSHSEMLANGCCIGLTGNVDSDPGNIIDLGDLTALIDYLFITFTVPACITEANIDGDPGGIVDLGDLTALIDFLFISFAPPAECLPDAVSCTSCHGGGDNETGAPPSGLRGEMATSMRVVGAHTLHLDGGSIADGFPCVECHTVPAEVGAPGHLDADSVAELTWGAMARAQSIWNPSTNACSQTYCHGNFSGGNAGNTPIWTSSGQATCGSCHDVGNDPNQLGGKHRKHDDKNIDCYRCHASTVNSTLDIVGTAIHVNDQNEVVFSSGNGTYTNGRCSSVGCHGTEDW
jgi:predicted CxxxxCH...CXXCH cytochrome family protein